MAVLGFVLLLMLGLWVALVGIATIVAGLGLTGKWEIGGIFLFLAGLLVMAIAILHAPISISINHP